MHTTVKLVDFRRSNASGNLSSCPSMRLAKALEYFNVSEAARWLMEPWSSGGKQLKRLYISSLPRTF